MTRVVVVTTLLVLFALAKVAYGRRHAAIADRSLVVHPRVPADLRGAGRTWIVFATQFCATCGPVTDRLRVLYPDHTVHKVLVEDRPHLADEHQVRTAPTVLEVDADGTVVRSVAGAPSVLAYVSELATA